MVFFHIITTKNNIIFWSKKICLSRETSQIYWLLHYIYTYTYTYTYTYIYIHIYIIPFNQRKKHNNLSFCILRILWVFKIRVSNLLSGLQYVFYNVWNIQDIEINLIIYIFIQNFIGHIYIYYEIGRKCFFFQLCRLTRKGQNKRHFKHVLFTLANMPSSGLQYDESIVSTWRFVFLICQKNEKHCSWMILERGLPTIRDPWIFINIYVIIVGFGASKASESHRTTFFRYRFTRLRLCQEKNSK